MKLESFDAAAKPKIIKEVKAMNPTFTLVAVRLTLSHLFHSFSHRPPFPLQAKNFVESLPQVLKENLPKEDAEKMKKAFEALGGVVVLD